MWKITGQNTTYFSEYLVSVNDECIYHKPYSVLRINVRKLHCVWDTVVYFFTRISYLLIFMCMYGLQRNIWRTANLTEVSFVGWAEPEEVINLSHHMQKKYINNYCIYIASILCSIPLQNITLFFFLLLSDCKYGLKLLPSDTFNKWTLVFLSTKRKNLSQISLMIIQKVRLKIVVNLFSETRKLQIKYRCR